LRNKLRRAYQQVAISKTAEQRDVPGSPALLRELPGLLAPVNLALGMLLGPSQ
jgi:hypothetical protein